MFGIGFHPQVGRRKLAHFLVIEKELLLVGHTDSKHAVVHITFLTATFSLGIESAESNDVVRMRTPFRILELAIARFGIAHQVPKYLARRIGHRKTIMLNHLRSRVNGIRSLNLERAAKIQPQHRSRIVFGILGDRGIANLLSIVHRIKSPHIGRRIVGGLSSFFRFYELFRFVNACRKGKQ